MRLKGMGQKLDKHWRAFSKWCDNNYAWRMANKRELMVIISQVHDYVPTSEYERLDRLNLLEQLFYYYNNVDW